MLQSLPTFTWCSAVCCASDDISGGCDASLYGSHLLPMEKIENLQPSGPLSNKREFIMLQNIPSHKRVEPIAHEDDVETEDEQDEELIPNSDRDQDSWGESENHSSTVELSVPTDEASALPMTELAAPSSIFAVRNFKVAMESVPCHLVFPPGIGPDEYEIFVERQAIGLGLVISDRNLRVIDIKAGAIADWNSMHPDATVQNGDKIVAVNGIMDPVLDVLKELRSAAVLSMVLRRSNGEFTTR